jgi:hypothetical protein
MNQVKEILKSQKGRFFSVTFVKRDGSVRTMLARTGVSKYCKGTGKPKAENEDLILVFDMVNEGYRYINTTTVSEIHARGVTIKVK